MILAASVHWRVSGAEQALEQAGKDDWTVVSVKDDWATVF